MIGYIDILPEEECKHIANKLLATFGMKTKIVDYFFYGSLIYVVKHHYFTKIHMTYDVDMISLIPNRGQYVNFSSYKHLLNVLVMASSFEGTIRHQGQVVDSTSITNLYFGAKSIEELNIKIDLNCN